MLNCKIYGIITGLLLCATFLSAQQNDAFRTALYQEHWAKAASVQEANMKSAPQDWLARMYLADAYIAAGRLTDAASVLRESAQITTMPAAGSYIVEGRQALLNNQKNEAIGKFDKAAKAGKKDIVALRLIGESWLYGPSRDLQMAETALLKALKRDNNDFLTRMDLGYCYTAMANGGAALVQFDLAQAIQPENPLPAFLSAMVYESAQVEAKHAEYLNKALTIDPKMQEAWRKKAEYLYYKKRDFTGAATAYARLIELDPAAPIDDKMAYANALFLTKQYAPTIEWVEQIIGADGSRNYLRRLSAYSYYETGDFEKGKAIMDEYFKQVTPDKIISQDYEYYAKFLLKDEQDSLAATFYEKAIELDSSRWDLLADIGTILYKAEDYPGAVAAYERRLDSLETRTALDYYQFGLALYMLQDSAGYVRAAENFTKVAEIVPDKTIGWLMLSRTLAKLEPDVETNPERSAEFGKARDAFEHFVKIAETEPDKHKKDLVSAYEYLAYYHILRQEAEQVKGYQEKLLALEPENESATNIAEWLETAPSTD